MELLAREITASPVYTMVNLCESIDSSDRVDGLEINDRNRTVTVDGREVKMTPIEYKISYACWWERRKGVSISQIYESIWHGAGWVGADNDFAYPPSVRRSSNPKEAQIPVCGEPDISQDEKDC